MLFIREAVPPSNMFGGDSSVHRDLIWMITLWHTKICFIEIVT